VVGKATSVDDYGTGAYGGAFAADVVEPFVCLADFVGETNPELGSATRTLGFLARSALEAASLELLTRVESTLRDVGISGSAAHGLEQLLLPDPLPVSLEVSDSAQSQGIDDFRGLSGHHQRPLRFRLLGHDP
jgi:hypothetical protein